MAIEQEPNPTVPPASPLTAPAVKNFVAAAEPVAEGAPSPIRSYLAARGSGGLADKSFEALMLLCALSIFAIVVFIFAILVMRSKLTLDKFGFSFFTRSAWDPVNGDFGALPFIFGTLVTSLLALAMSVPLALGVAVFLTEPRIGLSDYSLRWPRNPAPSSLHWRMFKGSLRRHARTGLSAPTV